VGWSIGFNDDTPIGWTITAAYAATCVASALAIRRDPRPRFWVATTLAILLLGVNKQLDLQTPFLHAGHVMLSAAGLWERRRIFRALLELIVLAVGVGFVVATRRLLRGAWRDYLAPLAGLAGLAAFVAMRAAAFNHMGDRHGGRILYSSTIAAVLELGSVLLVLAGAVRVLSRRAT
jgi:hypothetical protein